MDIEVENTYRALKDEPAIALRQWRCKVNLHLWSQYSEAYIPKNGKYNIQHRHCINCNLMQIRRIADFV